MWESCRTMPLVCVFSWGSTVSPAPSFRRCSILTSITLNGSQDLAPVVALGNNGEEKPWLLDENLGSPECIYERLPLPSSLGGIMGKPWRSNTYPARGQEPTLLSPTHYKPDTLTTRPTGLTSSRDETDQQTAQKIKKISLCSTANQTQGPFPEPHAANKRLYKRNCLPIYIPFTVTSHFSEALLNFSFQEIPPPHATQTWLNLENYTKGQRTEPILYDELTVDGFGRLQGKDWGTTVPRHRHPLGFAISFHATILFQAPILFTSTILFPVANSLRYTQCDVNTARQLRALSLTTMVSLMCVAVSPLSLLRFSATNSKNIQVGGASSGEVIDTGAWRRKRASPYLNAVGETLDRISRSTILSVKIYFTRGLRIPVGEFDMSNIPAASAAGELGICLAGGGGGASPRPLDFRSASLPMSYGGRAPSELLRQVEIMKITSARSSGARIAARSAERNYRKTLIYLLIRNETPKRYYNSQGNSADQFGSKEDSMDGSLTSSQWLSQLLKGLHGYLEPCCLQCVPQLLKDAWRRRQRANTTIEVVPQMFNWIEIGTVRGTGENFEVLIPRGEAHYRSGSSHAPEERQSKCMGGRAANDGFITQSIKSTFHTDDGT
ncbi:hypothetical protein PR048_001888 [Dryococelus australis]|uniref:Uncharacterized protein n=1 Tax=Dryococelus australis TaxID=614101 RepID=A0ABQ9IK06_9NEOP|nr:hypothetical protein PR048_001888 [Dryococelus australis]